MREFLSIIVAVAIGFSGVIMSSHFSHSSSLPTPANTTEEASFLIVEAEESNAVEVDGIRFENIIEGRIFPIPEKGSEDYTPVEISLKITNNSSTQKRFTCFDNLVLHITDSTGETRWIAANRNWTREFIESDFPVVQPGENLIFSINFKLMWWYGDIKLRAEDGFGGWFSHSNVRPGHYLMNLSYAHLPTRFDDGFYKFYDPEIDDFIVIDDLWIGSIHPKFTLIQIIVH